MRDAPADRLPRRRWAEIERHVDDAAAIVQHRRPGAIVAEQVAAHAQSQGRMRAGPPEVLIALIIGAFTGLVRFVREGRVVLDSAASELAEQACWDLVRA